MVKLGSRVKDWITGFQGIAIGRVEYLYGCSQILIIPETLKEDNVRESKWFDEQRVLLIEEIPVFVSELSSATAGGDELPTEPSTPPTV